MRESNQNPKTIGSGGLLSHEIKTLGGGPEPEAGRRSRRISAAPDPAGQGGKASLTVDKTVPVLFARKNSIYNQIPCCDVWDISRDAMTWPGGRPLIAHPPCAQWGRLRGLAKNSQVEKNYAIHAVDLIRKYGGVLEHPAGSILWKDENISLPRIGHYDAFGGYTIAMPQYWFGHKAMKHTWFYILGCKPEDLPEIPLKISNPQYVVSSVKRKERKDKKELSRCGRESTPLSLAQWLVEVIKRINTKKIL